MPRVRKILENARAKGRAEVEAQLQALARAKDRDREAVEEALRINEFANQNPVEFYRQVTERFRSDPSLRAEVERVWQPPQPQASAPEPQAQTDEKPQPDVLLEDGRLVYSSAQMDRLLGWQERQLEGKVRAKLEPIEKARRQQELNERINAEATRAYQEALTLDGFSPTIRFWLKFGDMSIETSRIMSVYINYLRKKIEKDPANPKYFLTERGVGSRFVDFRRQSPE